MSFFQVTYINPGIRLWYIIRDGGEPGKQGVRGDIIVPVTAVEVNDVYVHPKNPELPACWASRFPNPAEDYVSVPLEEKDENGWNKYSREPLSWLGDAKPVNQFVWIDEPVGHSIQVGDYHDGLYLTLQEAQRNARPSKQKHLWRRFKQYRNRIHRFIAKTWLAGGYGEHPGFAPLPEKRIYVRKK